MTEQINTYNGFPKLFWGKTSEVTFKASLVILEIEELRKYLEHTSPNPEQFNQMDRLQQSLQYINNAIDRANDLKNHLIEVYRAKDEIAAAVKE